MIVTVGEESSSDFEVDIEYNMTNVKTVELVSLFDTDSGKENVISWEEFETYSEEVTKDTPILDYTYVTINRSEKMKKINNKRQPTLQARSKFGIWYTSCILALNLQL